MAQNANNNYKPRKILAKVVISNEILNSPNCGVEGSHSPNEQDPMGPRYNEDGFRAKYSPKYHH